MKKTLLALCLFLSCSILNFAAEGNSKLIALIGAMEEETNGMVSKLENVETNKVGLSVFYKGTYKGIPCVIARCGIGKVHAAACTQVLIDLYEPTAIVNNGVAGALVPELEVGDVVISTGAVQHDFDLTPIGFKKGQLYESKLILIPNDKKLEQIVTDAVKKNKSKYIAKAIATGDSFVDSAKDKIELGKAFNAGACDMEGAAISVICHENGIPFAAYRTISDSVEETNVEYLKKMKMAADESIKIATYILEFYGKDAR